MKKGFYHFQEFELSFRIQSLAKKVLKKEITTESWVTITFVLMLTWILIIVQQEGSVRL